MSDLVESANELASQMIAAGWKLTFRLVSGEEPCWVFTKIVGQWLRWGSGPTVAIAREKALLDAQRG